MKAKLVLTLLGVLTAGCIGLPENAREHDECNAFRNRLVSDVRVAFIVAHKPNQNIYVVGDSRVLIICINSPEVITFESDGRERFGPGNMYTPEELAVIENVALDIRTELGIKRNIVVVDDSTGREHRARKSQAAETPSP